MKLLLILLTVVCLFSSASLSAQTEDNTSAVHVSFIPPLSTNGLHAGKYTNKFSFNILAGLSRNETGLALAGLTNIILHDAKGIQIAGLGNYTGNNATSMQFAGLTNIVNKELTGFQLAGLGNTSGNATGFQLAGISNFSRELTGFQFAGIGNISDDVTGFQFAGIFNVAKNVTGFQFAGILNIADESDHSIGIINLIRNGEYGLALTYNELGSTALTFRSGGRVFYGILGVGYNHKASGGGFLTEAGYGAHINCLPWLRINNELKLSTIGQFKKNNTFVTSYSLLPGFRIGNHLELFGGPSINYMRADDPSDKVIPSNHLWKKDGSSLQQIYIGYQCGVQYLF